MYSTYELSKPFPIIKGILKLVFFKLVKYNLNNLEQNFVLTYAMVRNAYLYLFSPSKVQEASHIQRLSKI